ncbi:phage tail tape measure protein [Ruminococcus sp. 2227st1_E6_2227SCRN_220401]|uniref:phage tail tape measure protein n=1 Tax=unclassified Ruminococcus TaxID=2608920 RepID=UPI00319E1DA3
MGMDSVFRVSLVLDMVDNMTSKVQGAADRVPSAVQKMNDAFGTMQKAGAAMTGMGTAIVGACMGTVTATFDTQDALAEVASLGVEDLGTLEKAAKNFSDTWAGTTKSDFISASYDIKSGIASLTDEGVAQYTELAGLTAKATKATTADMTSLFATGYGIYKNYYSDLSDMEFGEMFSAGIATAVKNYKTSGTEMAGAIKMLGASATNANVPMEEQLAILGQLQATMSGTEAGTKYKSFLNTAASAGEKLGLNFLDANNQLLSMPDILEQLHGKYGDTIDAVEKKQLKDAFGTDEAIALIDLLYNNTDQLKTGIDDLQTSMDGGVETTKKMAEAINDTPAQKFQVLKQQMHNVTEELGQGLLPAVNTGLEAMIGLVQKGSDWVSNNQETVATIMRIVAILGVFLIVAGVVTTTVGTLGKAMTTLKTVTTLASKASGLFNSALLSSPITWVIGLIVALIAIFKACGGDVEQLGATFSNIFGKVGGFVGTAATAIAQKLPEFLQFGINLVLQIVSGIASGLPSLISGGVSMLESLITGIQTIAPTLLSVGLSLLLTLLSGILQAVPSILQAGEAIIQSLLTGIIQYLPTILSAGLQILSMLVQGIVTGLPALLSAGISLIQMILTGIIQNLPSVISAGLQILGMLAQGIATGLPQLLAQALQLIPLVLQAIASGLPSLIISGIQIILMILSGLISAIPTLIGMIPELFSGVVDAVTSIDWLDVGANLVNSIKDGFVNGFSSLVDTAKGLWDDFTGWLFGEDDAPDTTPVAGTAAAIENDIPKVETAVDNANQALSTLDFNPDSLQQKGTESMQALADGITAGTPTAQTEAQNAGQSILDNFNLDTTGAGSAGTNLMQSVTDGINTGTPEAQAAAQNAGQEIMSSFNIDTSGAGTAGTSLIESVTSGITANAGNAQVAAQNAGQEIMSAFSIDTSGAGSAGANLMQSVTDGITSGTAGAEAAAQSAGQEIMSAFSTDTSGAGTAGANLIQDITSGITSGTGDTTSAAQKAGMDAMNAFQGAVSSANQLGRQMMSDVASGISSAGSSAVSTAFGIAHQIKAAFENIRITVPRPSLPHVNVSYSTVGSGKATASVPNFSVSYYAKGALLKKPTVFGMNGLNPMVGGEAGEEAIVPLDSLWTRMQNIITGIFSTMAQKKSQTTEENKTGYEKSTVIRKKKEETEKTFKSRTSSGTQSKKTTVIQKLYINVDMDDIDSFKKLQKLIDEIEGDIPATT